MDATDYCNDRYAHHPWAVFCTVGGHSRFYCSQVAEQRPDAKYVDTAARGEPP